MEREKEKESVQRWQKKIMPYLDGSLSVDDHSEFEAYVRTHPEFKNQVDSKINELAQLKSLIPSPALPAEEEEALMNEMRLSVFNLLKEEPKNIWDSVRSRVEDWLSR
jgi:anti-sigma factor RsiW